MTASFIVSLKILRDKLLEETLHSLFKNLKEESILSFKEKAMKNFKSSLKNKKKPSEKSKIAKNQKNLVPVLLQIIYPSKNTIGQIKDVSNANQAHMYFKIVF